MNSDFANFQRHFKRYQQRFGLTGYQVYFKCEPLDSCFADISCLQNRMVVTVRLNSESQPEGEEPRKSIRSTAKHEAIHLLLYRLEHLARCRYVADEEIYEAEEELVVKLEGLIGEVDS